MQYYKLNKYGESKIKPADCQILRVQVQIFFYNLEHFKYKPMPYMLKLETKKAFVTKLHWKEASGLITITGMLSMWKELSIPQKLKLVEKLQASVS